MLESGNVMHRSNAKTVGESTIYSFEEHWRRVCFIGDRQNMKTFCKSLHD